MTRDALLRCWLAGAPMAALAELLGEQPDVIEDAIRMELRLLAHAEQGAGAASEAAPSSVRAQRAQAMRGGSRQNSSSVRARRASGPEKPTGSYPEKLRGPRATLRRAIWDALEIPLRSTAEIAAAIQSSPASVDATLRDMRRDGLVLGDGNVPQRWSRAVEAAK